MASQWKLVQRLLGALLLLVCLSGFMLVAVRTAWLCDDAYISFRTVDNFVNGYGLRWNVAERVQAYTHPLWLFVVAAAYHFTHEVYATVQILSLVLTFLAAGIVVFVLIDSTASAVVAVATLAFSKAFVDYSTSGLENPLSHLLLVMFLAVYFSGREEHRKTLLLSFIAACAALTRVDTLLIYGPALLWHLVRVHRLRSFLFAALGFVPLAVWEAFSLVYYGYLVPNTAYAKLDTGIAQAELARQGFAYFISLAEADPLTLAILVAGLSLPILLSQTRAIAISLGALLYLAYVVYIGGDFMCGRFVTVPFLAAVVLFAAAPMRPVHAAAALLTVTLLGFMAPYPAVLTDATYGADRLRIPGNAFRDERGVSDQRGFYYQATGLLRGPENGWEVKHVWANEGHRLRKTGAKIAISGTMGFRGFYGGPNVHIIDIHALCDPLLARLPARDPVNWQIGHFRREMPKGYDQTLVSGENRLLDKDLAAYYDKLALITRGPLLDAERLRTALALHRGEYDDLLAAYIARIPKTNTPRGNRGEPESADSSIRSSVASAPGYDAPPPGSAQASMWTGDADE